MDTAIFQVGIECGSHRSDSLRKEVLFYFLLSLIFSFCVLLLFPPEQQWAQCAHLRTQRIFTSALLAFSGDCVRHKSVQILLSDSTRWHLVMPAEGIWILSPAWRKQYPQSWKFGIAVKEVGGLWVGGFWWN